MRSRWFPGGRVDSLLLLRDPSDVLPDGLVFQKQFLRMVLVGEFLFIWNQVVDSTVTFLADHQAPLTHFLFAEAVYISLFRVDRLGNEMMFGQLFPTVT